MNVQSQPNHVSSLTTSRIVLHLVSPQRDYAQSDWSPHTRHNIGQTEVVQCLETLHVTYDYSHGSLRSFE